MKGMIVNMKNLKASVKKISQIINKNVDVLDKSGIIICSSDETREGTMIEHADACTILSDSNRHSIYVDRGSDEEISLSKMIIENNISEGTADNYQQFLINIMDGYDEPNEYCRQFNILPDGNFIVYCVNIPSSEHYHDAYTLIANSFYDSNDIWVFPYKKDVVLLEQTDELYQNVKSNARMIEDMINSEIYTHAYVGVGNMHSGILNMKKSFKEAKEAVRIGRIFNLPDNIYIYKDTLAERIINLIPGDKILDLMPDVSNIDFDSIIDDEMIKTVNAMFKNDLNISDSARNLYIHRNTLVYRIDKIEKITGLDIRKFEDAVIFKLIFLLKSRK